MLPTNKKAKLYIDKEGIYTKNRVDNSILRHYLYIIRVYDTKDETSWIKEGDWFIADEYSKPEMAIISGNKVNGYLLKGCKKIIATTDKSLNLPEPSQAFIEKYIEEYNKGNIITNVMVEYGIDIVGKSYDMYDEKAVKVKSNTITIKKVKDSWNREEVEALCKKAFTHYHNTNMTNGHFEIWIEENL